ncbi:Histidine kinase-like ATPase, ATP-binding domain [Pseudocohnilembus persalinus]|uniref:Histidine kinase-like ATPase, ATP-binding domain n=1 Tax=Pseudocohnilembus persalinus TaxID=266149 RepID=A0A0V0Q8L5_PSEPJ|nr:Histidine kinase-like ATPase, ATP-binding domain [Pseudocohnilembus persalinus]|eukprot:KRW98534.1 Histidine kinase-like ATPase, ATP-binding domain [Pseudocohnilembus persalinus]
MSLNQKQNNQIWLQIFLNKFKIQYMIYWTEIMASNAKLNKIELKLEYKIDDIPNFIVSDQQRIRQIVMNLISNSLKFTSEGEIKLKVEKMTKNIYKISVQDTGIGISQEDLKKLFVKFGKVGKKQTQLNPTGIGLGLEISQLLSKSILSHTTKKEKQKIDQIWKNKNTLHVDSYNGEPCPKNLLNENGEPPQIGTCFSFLVYDYCDSEAFINQLNDHFYNPEKEREKSNKQIEQFQHNNNNNNSGNLKYNDQNKTNTIGSGQNNRENLTEEEQRKEKLFQVEEIEDEFVKSPGINSPNLSINQSSLGPGSFHKYQMKLQTLKNAIQILKSINQKSNKKKLRAQKSFESDFTYHNHIQQQNNYLENDYFLSALQMIIQFESQINRPLNKALTFQKMFSHLSQSNQNENQQDKQSSILNQIQSQSQNQKSSINQSSQHSKFYNNQLNNINQNNIQDAQSYINIGLDNTANQKYPQVQFFNNSSSINENTKNNNINNNSNNSNNFQQILQVETHPNNDGTFQSLVFTKDNTNNELIQQQNELYNDENDSISSLDSEDSSESEETGEKNSYNNNNFKNNVTDNGSSNINIENEQMSQQINNPNCQCAQFLIIDDEMINILGLKTYIEMYFLQKTGDQKKPQIEKALSGQKGVEIIKEKISNNQCCKNFQIIFLDINMPGGINGFETQEQIQLQYEQYNNLHSSDIQKIPQIIATTGYVDKEIREKFKYYLEKAVDKTQLFKLLDDIYDINQ